MASKEINYGLLDSVHPELKRISQAPKPPDGANEAWFESERKKLYKTIDQENNIYLVQNPHAWKVMHGGGKDVGKDYFYRPRQIASDSYHKPQDEKPEVLVNGELW